MIPLIRFCSQKGTITGRNPFSMQLPFKVYVPSCCYAYVCDFTMLHCTPKRLNNCTGRQMTYKCNFSYSQTGHLLMSHNEESSLSSSSLTSMRPMLSLSTSPVIFFPLIFHHLPTNRYKHTVLLLIPLHFCQIFVPGALHWFHKPSLHSAIYLAVYHSEWWVSFFFITNHCTPTHNTICVLSVFNIVTLPCFGLKFWLLLAIRVHYIYSGQNVFQQIYSYEERRDCLCVVTSLRSARGTATTQTTWLSSQ